MVELANNFDLQVDEADIEELLEVVPEEMANRELLELGQECIAEKVGREKELQEKGKKIPN